MTRDIVARHRGCTWRNSSGTEARRGRRARHANLDVACSGVARARIDDDSVGHLVADTGAQVVAQHCGVARFGDRFNPGNSERGTRIMMRGPQARSDVRVALAWIANDPK